MFDCKSLLSILIAAYAICGLLIAATAVVERFRSSGWRLNGFQLEWLLPATPLLRTVLTWYQRLGWLVIAACVLLLICSGGA
jgi:hypothetical protein